jgi:hypothetical protein
MPISPVPPMVKQKPSEEWFGQVVTINAFKNGSSHNIHPSRPLFPGTPYSGVNIFRAEIL